jgi:hypothetical protein
MSSQMAHRLAPPFKLGCGTRWVTLRFNIVLLYMTIYILSTCVLNKKHRRTFFVGNIWSKIFIF